MNWRKYLPHALGALWLLCLVGLVTQWWQRRGFEHARNHANAVAVAAQKFADSVRIVNAAAAERIAALTRSAAMSDSMASVWRQRARANEGALAQLAVKSNRLRDSLRLITTGADSLPVLVQLVANVSSENLTLRVGLADALRADSIRKLAVDSLTTGHLADSVRYELVFTSNKQLRGALEESQRALARADTPCNLLPFVKCPSRKAVAGVSLIVGGVAAAVYFKRGT